MKKNKQKAILKEEKKAVKKELNDQITFALQTIVIKFSASSKKIEKLIGKITKQLVKKLSKEKLSNSIIPETETVPAKKTVKPKVKKEEKPA